MEGLINVLLIGIIFSLLVVDILANLILIHNFNIKKWYQLIPLGSLIYLIIFNSKNK